MPREDRAHAAVKSGPMASKELPRSRTVPLRRTQRRSLLAPSLPRCTRARWPRIHMLGPGAVTSCLGGSASPNQAVVVRSRPCRATCRAAHPRTSPRGPRDPGRHVPLNTSRLATGPGGSPTHDPTGAAGAEGEAFPSSPGRRDRRGHVILITSGPP